MRASIEGQRPLVGHQLAFLTIIGFWVLNSVIVSLRASILEFPAQDELAMRRIAVTLVGIALTWLLYLVLRAFDRQRLSVKFTVAAIGALPVAAAIAWVNYYVFYLYDVQGYFDDSLLQDHIREVRESVGNAPWPEIVDNAIVRYFSILAWAAMYLAIGYAREIREAERTASRYAQAAQDAELRSLRYQVNPHFLFNTLNSLSSLVIKGDKDKAEAMIQNLSTFYRTSLSSDPLEEVTLAEEVELQKQYLEIEMVRFPERLRTEIAIPPELQDERVPALILQPLVENAIKYGVSRTVRPVTVRISAEREEGWMILRVHDDAEATPKIDGGIINSSSGIGLANVRDRLEARYGSAAKLIAGQHPKGGFEARIEIPIEAVDLLS
ncbi:MAG: sensor histidine kinase [Sphingorhabdus sp.]